MVSMRAFPNSTSWHVSRRVWCRGSGQPCLLLRAFSSVPRLRLGIISLCPLWPKPALVGVVPVGFVPCPPLRANVPVTHAATGQSLTRAEMEGLHIGGPSSGISFHRVAGSRWAAGQDGKGARVAAG
ncbi:hypothetical protein E2C01_040393 [Portunus trituberculatus]|uniref:Uncharacterized protein n=1 Tax=Portunus trituberculatus TaxID=210409 RepID=A0A5B7FP33_PORTR|nr:hypothetical protein [Portunus trituberculatus]